VTNVTSTKIAVTLPKQQKVQFISTLSNTLTKHYAIAVDGDCHGISCYQGKLVVSFYNPAKLQILDMDGKVLTKIINIFRSPLHVATSSSSIFVSDWGTKSVTRLSWKGEVIGSYGGMGFPSGLALSDDGTIFVCDNMKNVIEEIAEDCSAGTVVVKEIKSPYVVCWCAERKELYYCCFTMNDKDDNFLQIYKQAQL
jgi:DNA-binding beta-propeller fold protein YncE